MHGYAFGSWAYSVGGSSGTFSGDGLKSSGEEEEAEEIWRLASDRELCGSDSECERKRESVLI